MIRWPIYFLLLALAALLLYLIQKVRRYRLGPPVEMQLLLIPTVVAVGFGIFMAVRTVYYWLTVGPWGCDPPLNATLAAITIAVILSFLLTLIFCMKEKLPHHE
jgi:branched-subunit amino acid ABC-type transport system permease component